MHPKKNYPNHHHRPEPESPLVGAVKGFCWAILAIAFFACVVVAILAHVL